MDPERRKWVISQFFDLRRIVEHDYREESQKIEDYLIGLRAIDALHHLSKDGNIICSFCGKSQKELKKMVAGKVAHICDECIQLCCEVVGIGVVPDATVDSIPKEEGRS